MAEQLHQITLNSGAGHSSDQSPPDGGHDRSLIHTGDNTADAVVTDFPAVEVEVQARSHGEISGIQMLTAVVSQDQEMPVDRQDQNRISHPADPLVTSIAQTANSSMQVIVAPSCSKADEVAAVFVTNHDHDDTSKNIKEHQTSISRDICNDPKDFTGICEAKSSMHIPNQVHPNQIKNVTSDLSPRSDRKTPKSKLASRRSKDKDEEHAAYLAGEIVSTPDHESTVGKCEEHILQQDQFGEISKRTISSIVETTPEKMLLQNNLLWCEDCGKVNDGDCQEHGPLNTVSDSLVPTYAKLTLPSVLSIKKDSKGEGVFAKKYVKSRTQFGPLRAPFCKESSRKDEKQPYFYLKGYDDDDDDVMCQYNLSDEDRCNWMMFVRPAQTYLDQNLVAHLYDDKVYYTTIKPVEYGKELKVWYSSDYAVKIGMSLFSANTPDREVTAIQEEDHQPDVSNNSRDLSSDDAEDVDADSDEEFQIVENEDMSDEDFSAMTMYCVPCDTQFRSKEELFGHICKAKRMSSKRGRGRGATKRKGSPRKLTLDEDWNPSGDVKVKRNNRPVRKKPQDRTKSVRAKKTKMKEIRASRKKYQRNPRFACAYCPEVFTCQDPYRVHEATHTGKSAYMCDYEDCGKGFETKFTHWRHMLSHKKPNNKQCPYCDKKFSRSDHLKTHLSTHDQHRLAYLCDKCGKSYLHKKTYKYHMALHEAKDGVALDCMICGHKASDKEDLIKHTLSHSKYRSLIQMPKTHACHLCSRMFVTAKDVRRHMVVHTKEKHFLCELCPQTFGRKDHLQRHYKSNHSKDPRKEKTDDEELPYSCELCHQKFAKKKLLVNHKKFAHVKGVQAQMPPVEDHPLQQAAGEISEASVTSSSYNLYTLSTPQVNPTNPASVKALERYMNTNVTSSHSVFTTPPTVMDSTAPIAYINGQANMVSAVSQVQEQCPEQLQQVKDRVIFQSDQMTSVRQPRQMPWTIVVEERDDHSYSTVAPPNWTPKVPNFRPPVSTAAELETARLLQSAQSTHNTFPSQCNNPTTMAVAWDTMTDYFAVQPCSNITEVVTSSNIIHQPQTQQQQLQNQNLTQPQRVLLQQNHSQQ